MGLFNNFRVDGSKNLHEETNHLQEANHDEVENQETQEVEDSQPNKDADKVQPVANLQIKINVSNEQQESSTDSYDSGGIEEMMNLLDESAGNSPKRNPNKSSSSENKEAHSDSVFDSLMSAVDSLVFEQETQNEEETPKEVQSKGKIGKGKIVLNDSAKPEVEPTEPPKISTEAPKVKTKSVSRRDNEEQPRMQIEVPADVEIDYSPGNQDLNQGGESEHKAEPEYKPESESKIETTNEPVKKDDKTYTTESSSIDPLNPPPMKIIDVKGKPMFANYTPWRSLDGR